MLNPARPELTAADGTPEQPLPGSPALLAREDDAPRQQGRIKHTYAGDPDDRR